MSDDQACDSQSIKLVGFAGKDLYQSREKIFTRYVGGPFQKIRFLTGWPLLAAYFVTPWLSWNGQQAILFDLSLNQFRLFGLTFWAQDLWLLGWLLMVAAFALFTITAFVGRLWCGYTCPQTIWTAIFMWAEQITEGNRHQRIRLENAPFSAAKLRKRVSKHALWLGVSFLTGVTFVAYFVPARELAFDLVDVAETNIFLTWSGFWIVFFSAATYINAGWMREQICIYMCPYARFQSAMIDANTLVVSYDPSRGEPRGSRKRDVSTDLGSCIDCEMCVQVCPTGIDIRQGLQYECIGCAHCIDACNQVMSQMGYAKDLVSYTTANRLQGLQHKLLSAKGLGYAGVCVLLACAFALAVTYRNPFSFDLLREREALYHVTEDARARNDYQLIVLNKSQQPASYAVRVLAPDWLIVEDLAPMSVAAGELANFDLSLISDKALANTKPSAQSLLTSTEVQLQLCHRETQQCVTDKTRFLSPARAIH